MDSLPECLKRLEQPGAPGPALEPPLRITIWNAMKFRREGAPEMLAKLSADSNLVLLQESLRDQAPPSDLPFRTFATGYTTSAWKSGVEIRAAVDATGVCRLRSKEPWLRSPKAMNVARFALPSGTALLVINLHAINFTIGTEAYVRQLDTVSALLDAHEGPAIVGGDFNNWNSGREAILKRFAARNHLSPAEFIPDLRSRHLGAPIDGLLLRTMAVVTASAVPTRTSDHHPIIAVLTLSPASNPAAEPEPATVH